MVRIALGTTIYKICGRRAWDAALAAGIYEGSSDDARDGFIHFSTARQLPGTAQKHFCGRSDLVVAAFAADALGGALKWEAARNGQMFPHLYGALDPATALWVKPLDICDGAFRFAALDLEDGA